MDGHQTATKTRPTSSDSTDSSAESLLRSAGTVAPPPPASHLDEKNPSLEIYNKKELIMMPPEEKLKHFESRAKALEDNQEFDACIRELVRCVALTRLVHGDGHVKLAHAHARLAKAYFLFKGLALQAQKHSSKARELLSLTASTSTCREETLQVLTCLLSINLTQGGATLLTANLEEAESAFMKGQLIVEELHQMDGINAVEKMQTELEISIGLSRVYQKQRRLEKALGQCAKSLQLLDDSGKPEATCSVYRDMAAIERDRDHLEKAAEYLSKCHEIQTSLYGPQHKETRATQKAVEALTRAPAATDKRRRKGREEMRSHVSSTASGGKDGDRFK
ncbi:tetratricopeptide repeat protein 23 [Genypterus blacodes]|uniref:tetratricopeptide repeat protein 23 n=1 Tax=Genypterus blacodes TaxID=154954 RepID=UPI003F75A9A9